MDYELDSNGGSAHGNEEVTVSSDNGPEVSGRDSEDEETHDDDFDDEYEELTADQSMACSTELDGSDTGMEVEEPKEPDADRVCGHSEASTRVNREAVPRDYGSCDDKWSVNGGWSFDSVC